MTPPGTSDASLSCQKRSCPRHIRSFRSAVRTIREAKAHRTDKTKQKRGDLGG